MTEEQILRLWEKWCKSCNVRPGNYVELGCKILTLYAGGVNTGDCLITISKDNIRLCCNIHEHDKFTKCTIEFYEILQQLKDFGGDADSWLTNAIIKKFKINEYMVNFCSLSGINNIIKVMGIEIDKENCSILSVSRCIDIRLVEDLIKIVKTYKLLRDIENEK